LNNLESRTQHTASRSIPRSRSAAKLLPLLVLILLPSVRFTFAQTKVTSTATSGSDVSFSDTRDGLRQFLLECIQEAKANDSKLNADILSTEIPDYAKWFPATWPEPGPSWVEPYGKDLRKNEAHLRRLFTYLSHQDGELVVRKVNDEPQGGKGMEWGMLQGMAQPVDIFYASWKSDPGPPLDERDTPIGYFFYVNNGFRWDSTVRFGLKLVHRVAPVYPYQDDGKHPHGTVMFRFVVAGDGSVEGNTIQPMTLPGTVADAKLIKAASDALKHWRYLPPNLYGESESLQYARIEVAPAAQANP
jgi:hypothetical protein